jgi:Leucine-rich repeat (LRR) protein
MKKVLLLTMILSFFALNNFGQKATKTINYSEDGIIISDEMPTDVLTKNDDYILKYKAKKHTIQQTTVTEPSAPVKAFIPKDELPDLIALKQCILAKSKISTNIKGDGTFVSVSDSLALVAFYTSTNGVSWTDNTNWLSGPVDSWFGINVNGGLVTSIVLGSNNLTGTIPTELGQLTSITLLDLQTNQITGEIPSEIGNLNNLTRISFWQNQLTGSIPPELGNLINLTFLDFDENQLSGSIPTQLGNLSSLTDLWLDVNQLTSDIPSELGNLTNLEMLGLALNNLTGSIPSELENISNLIFLGLYTNQLSGEIPAELGNLSNLVYLYLNDNLLTGSIPAELGNLTSLQVLYIYNNQLTGSIPAELGNLSFLQYFYIHNNQITGSIPTELGNLTEVIRLGLYNNQLTGSIPAELGGMTNLARLYLYDNQLTDSIPTELGNLSDLQYLDLYDNQLTGSIPSELGSLTFLERITVQNNQLSGIVPSEIGNLTVLSNLNLNYNQFNDLPDLSSTGIQYLYLLENQFSFGDFENTSVDFSTLTEIEYTPQSKIEAPDQTDNGNGTTTLTVTTDGTGNTFQWYSNKGILGGETANTITVDNTIEGYYYCAVSNATYPDLVLETEYAALNLTMNHGVVEEEYNALVTFYNETNGTEWTQDTCWLTDNYVDEWVGITVIEGHVTEINLATNNLTGTLTGELGSLDSLLYLNIDHNEITGEIPAELGNLSQLLELNLWENKLSGNIPSELGGLTELTTLDIGYNQISGLIPAELGNLSALENLWLNDLQLSGEIPSEIGNLTNLQILGFSTNQLTGEIPSEFGDLTSLSRLYLHDNQLSGEIPVELGSLSNLIYLYLYNNQLTGSIPSELGNLSNLQRLYLYSNQLTGSIPSELGSLSNLQNLYLYGNQLTGSIPSEIGNCSNLRSLSLSNNQLTGSIPSEIWNLTTLYSISLRNNQLSGTIPVELGNLTGLTTLSLRYNNFEGLIPTEIENLTNMQFLYLSNNNFTNGVDLSALTSLIILYVNNNELSFGDIENYNISFSNPNYFYSPQTQLPEPTQTPSGDDIILSFTTDGTGNTYQWYKEDEVISGETTNALTIANTESGIFYCEIQNSNYPQLILTTKAVFINSTGANGITEAEYDALEAFYTATNGDNWYNNTNWLSEEDVNDWFGISVVGGHVTKLDLLYNNLTGTIPTEIGDLTYLDRIEIKETGNGLTGSIPAEIGNLENLTYLNIFQNSLSGEIPAEIGNLTNLEYLNLNFNNLTGEIPVEIGGLTSLSTLSLNNNILQGNLPEELGNMSNLVTLYLHANEFDGNIPDNFANLTTLEYVQLNDNKIIGLPDLSSLTNLNYLEIYNNNLTFEDLENTKLDVGTLSFFYSPQANLEMVNHERYISEGNSITLSCDILTTEALSSENNLYAIYKDGDLSMDWSSDPDYIISSFASGDVGEYAIQVKNTEYTDLILYSDTLTLEINNAPSSIAISTNSIDENSAIASIIGQFSTTDADAEDSFTYSFVAGDGTNDADNSSFSIEDDSLKTAAELNYESQSEYYIYVQTEDADGLTYEKAFVITITDINEIPSNIELTTNSIDENSAIGSTIGQLSTTDVDDGDSFTYTLVAGDGTNDADNASFTIESENLKTAVELNYETKTTYNINVRTTDADGLTFEKAFTINVNDVTETGLNDLDELKWTVYPNPSNGNFTLEFNSNRYQVKVYDIIGNVIYDQVSTSPKHNIDLIGIASGTYFISIQNNNHVLTKKLQIQ